MVAYDGVQPFTSVTFTLADKGFIGVRAVCGVRVLCVFSIDACMCVGRSTHVVRSLMRFLTVLVVSVIITISQ